MKKCMVLLFALMVTWTASAESIFVKIDEIPGGETRLPYAGQIEALAFSHEIISPRDVATGQASGKRQHTPIRFVFRQEKSTPLLYQALAQNKVIPNIVVSFVGTNPNGEEEIVYKIELKNASVSSVRAWKPNVLDQAVALHPPQVEVAFVYQTIIWTDNKGKVTFEDSWAVVR